MSSYRRARINDAVREELSLALQNSKDPRLSGSMVSILSADVSPDLKTAKIRYSVYGGDTEEAVAGIESAAGYFRRELARRLNLRITPELTFLRDDSIAHGARIAQLLREVLPEKEEPAANGRKSEESDG
ncbi:MAG: 30S ribosome-binding factor RbfA [Clostridia bacterium]|nr:30S ribosome-binding factor RbfA [Clostridia bacterium]